MAVIRGKFAEKLAVSIHDAGFTLKVDEFGLGVLGTGTIVWVALMALQLNPLVAMLLLPVTLGGVAVLALKWLGFKKARRIAAFTDQLDLVLRMLAGALRVGLGLRQAVILVAEEVQDPARREFMRLIGRTNVGVTTLEAFDELADAMKSAEMTMMAKAMRVQAQTGGDLAKVLDTLADTIKDRRRIHRKMRALTAQGRGGAYVVGALPVFVGGFIVLTQHSLGNALMFTLIGRIVLGGVALLEGAALVSLSKILQFDV